MNPEALEDLDVEGVGGSHTTEVYPVDLIRHGLSQLTPAAVIVGGDFNASIRFDDVYPKSHPFYGNVEWFTKAREAG